MHFSRGESEKSRSPPSFCRQRWPLGARGGRLRSGEGVRAAGQASACMHGGCQNAEGRQEEGSFWGERQRLQLWIWLEALPAKGRPHGDVAGTQLTH